MSSASVAQEGSGAGEIELYDELFEKFKEGRVFEAPAFADTPDQPKEVPKVRRATSNPTSFLSVSSFRSQTLEMRQRPATRKASE